MKIVVHGSKGRMGQALIACAPKYGDCEIVGQIDLRDPLESIKLADVVIDFSSPNATAELVYECAKDKVPLVMGTTGHSEDKLIDIRLTVNNIPIVKATNFSVGVNVLFWLTRKTDELLGPDFDPEITEIHHRMKKDAPSGTAKTLAKIIADERKYFGVPFKHGRNGLLGERPEMEIGIHSVRGGDAVGEHTVMFLGDGERVELTHKVSSRETFALGALRAAKWVLNKPPGLYDMQDVLGLR